MTEKESALYSQYIIDGIRHEAAPADLLDECMRFPHPQTRDSQRYADIIDEATDPPVTSFTYDPDLHEDYMQSCANALKDDRSFRMLYPDTFTRQRIAASLIDRLWNDGHYRLGDLTVWARWSWNTRPLGNMAAFYTSAEAVGMYLFDLGVRLADYIFEEEDEESHARFFSWLPEKEDIEDGMDDAVEPDLTIFYENTKTLRIYLMKFKL